MREILVEVASAIPQKTRVYLFGGAMRNAIFYDYFGKKQKQRDYDLFVIGDGKKFVQNLRKKGFIYGKLRRKRQIVLKKKKIAHPKNEYNHYVILDIKFSPDKKPIDSLKRYADFTISGVCISLAYVNSPAWKKKLITVTHSLSDIRHRILRTHTIHSSTIMSCIRFMSLGFAPPTKKEVRNLLDAWENFDKRKLSKITKKVYNYVGGKTKALKLARKIDATIVFHSER